ncbi:MAG: 3-dehydroquinate synthase [Pseudomonadota bacterium]
MSENAITTVTVALAGRSYDIHIGQRLLTDGDRIASLVRGQQAIVVSNHTVAPLYLDALLVALGRIDCQVHVLPDGEQYKTLAHVADILDTALASNAARDVTFIALGGGVVGDMTGFAAACFMRGVAFVQVPTTLLAQVDSSVGGKTGVNHPRGKNLIGAFHQPVGVVIDTDTLSTLDPREYSAGLAEVIKYGAIMDLAFFEWLEANIEALRARDPEAVAYAVAQCCTLKARVVADDETEQGNRALLNFGHTFGHAVEAVTGYTTWLHGEAVAIGMRLAAQMSAIDADEQQRLVALLAAAGLPVAAPGLDADALLKAMGHDKKVLAGRIRLILLRSLGDAFVTDAYDDARLTQTLAAVGG